MINSLAVTLKLQRVQFIIIIYLLSLNFLPSQARTRLRIRNLEGEWRKEGKRVERDREREREVFSGPSRTGVGWRRDLTNVTFSWDALGWSPSGTLRYNSNSCELSDASCMLLWHSVPLFLDFWWLFISWVTLSFRQFFPGSCVAHNWSTESSGLLFLSSLLLQACLGTASYAST